MNNNAEDRHADDIVKSFRQKMFSAIEHEVRLPSYVSKDRTKLTFTDTPIHCECALLAFLYKKNISAYPFIGASKLSCYACHVFFKAYNSSILNDTRPALYTNGTHGKIYIPWVAPQLDMVGRGPQVLDAKVQVEMRELLKKDFALFVEASMRSELENSTRSTVSNVAVPPMSMPQKVNRMLEYFASNPAEQKLCKHPSFDAEQRRQAIAVLGQRFAFHICFGHPTSVRYITNGIASQMRTCISTSEDHSWQYTSYPSEPFLSHVSATLLHQSPRNLNKSLECLREKLADGMIDIGQNGELISRLLWLLGKDFTSPISLTQPSTQRGEQLHYCKPVRVLDYLETLLGEEYLPKDSKEADAAKDALKNSYVNYSHWITMDKNIAAPVSWE